MANVARGYLDALRALSGDPAFAEARQNLIKGLSDATLEDYIRTCLDINTSRVVREHIIESLLDVADRDHAQPESDGGYLDALRALSGNPAFASARRNLVKQASDATLDETIKEGLRRCTSRTEPERVLMFLLDAVTEQTRSRAQQDLAAIKEENDEQQLDDATEERQHRSQSTSHVVGLRAAASRLADEEGAAIQDDVSTSHRDQMSSPLNTVTRKRGSSDPNRCAKKARILEDSSAKPEHAIPERKDSDTHHNVKRMVDDDIEEGELVDTVQQPVAPEPHAPLHPIRVRLRLSDLIREELRKLGKLPEDVKKSLLEDLANDYGFNADDEASYGVVLQHGGVPSKTQYRCINTRLHGQGKCKWKGSNKLDACNYCVETGRLCARLEKDKKGHVYLVIHSLPAHLRVGVSFTSLEYWKQDCQRNGQIQLAQQAAEAETIHAKEAWRLRPHEDLDWDFEAWDEEHAIKAWEEQYEFNAREEERELQAWEEVEEFQAWRDAQMILAWEMDSDLGYREFHYALYDREVELAEEEEDYEPAFKALKHKRALKVWEQEQTIEDREIREWAEEWQYFHGKDARQMRYEARSKARQEIDEAKKRREAQEVAKRGTDQTTGHNYSLRSKGKERL